MTPIGNIPVEPALGLKARRYAFLLLIATETMLWACGAWPPIRSTRDISGGHDAGPLGWGSCRAHRSTALCTDAGRSTWRPLRRR
jgi:hypothetical protein